MSRKPACANEDDRRATMNTESYRFNLGSFECIVVSDGTFAYPNPARLFFTNAPAERLSQAARANDAPAPVPS